MVNLSRLLFDGTRNDARVAQPAVLRRPDRFVVNMAQNRIPGHLVALGQGYCRRKIGRIPESS
jgi:hypothetical protein